VNDFCSLSVVLADGILIANMAHEQLDKTIRASAETWRKHYDGLCWYFPAEEAHEYAEELTQVAEGRKRETESLPDFIC